MLTLHMFSTSGCKHCPGVKKILDEIVAEANNTDDFVVSYTVVDKEENGMNLAMEWGVTSVPQIVVIADREEQGRFIGSTVTKQEIQDHVERYLQRDVFQKSSGGEPDSGDSVLCDIGQQTDPES